MNRRRWWWLLWLACAAAAQAATVTGGTLAPGTRYETPYVIRDSGRPGPTVLVSGGVHGDEAAGAVAAAVIAEWEPLNGRLIVLPRANLLGLHAGTRNVPGEPDDVANLNRCFPPEDAADPSAKGVLATAIWTWVQEQRPMWLFDLHEGYGVRKAGSASVGSSVIHLARPAAKALAEQMVSAVNAGIGEPERQFVRLSGCVQGSLARAAGRMPGCCSMILETTTAGQRLPRRVGQHLLMMRLALRELGLVDGGVPALAELPPAVPSTLRVAVYRGGGTGGQSESHPILRIANGMPDARAWPVDAADIRRKVLGGFDVVVIPGGSGSAEAKALQAQGAEQVQRFVRAGGGYLGVCAGAYLATAKYPWGLRLIAAQTVDSEHWARGKGTVAAELSEAGRKLWPGAAPTFGVHYQNGPLLGPFAVDGLTDYTVLAWFRSEVTENGATAGVMKDSPAAICGRCGQGRVLLWSPHPEATKALATLIEGSLRWLSGRDESAPAAAK